VGFTGMGYADPFSSASYDQPTQFYPFGADLHHRPLGISGFEDYWGSSYRRGTKIQNHTIAQGTFALCF
jgi:hypothetical protein